MKAQKAPFQEQFRAQKEEFQAKEEQFRAETLELRERLQFQEEKSTVQKSEFQAQKEESRAETAELREKLQLQKEELKIQLNALWQVLATQKSQIEAGVTSPSESGAPSASDSPKFFKRS